MPYKPGEGGRPAGVTNRGTREVKKFLEGVFAEVFAREEFRRGLIERMVRFDLDTRLFQTLLAYHAGRPAVSIDHTVGGTLSLAQLIAGELPEVVDETHEPPDDEFSVQ